MYNKRTESHVNIWRKIRLYDTQRPLVHKTLYIILIHEKLELYLQRTNVLLCTFWFYFNIYPLEICFCEYAHVQSSEGSVAYTEGKMQTHACVISVIFVKFCRWAATRSAQFVSYSSKTTMNGTPAPERGPPTALPSAVLPRALVPSSWTNRMA